MAKITIDTDKDSPETIHSAIMMLQQAVQGRAVNQPPVQPTPAQFHSSLPSTAPVQSNPFDTSSDAQKSGGIFDVFSEPTPSAPPPQSQTYADAPSAPATSIFDEPTPTPNPQPQPQVAGGGDIFSLFNDEDKAPSLPSTDPQQFGSGSAQDLIKESVGFDIPSYEETKDSFTPQEEKKETEFFRVQAYDD